MNRRQFLKGLSASAAALVVPAAKRDERDARIEELEEALEIEQGSADVWYGEYLKADQDAADLAVQAAYWQEQYEQVKAQRDLLIEDECIILRRQKPLIMDNLGLMVKCYPDDLSDHFYQGQSHTEDEWQAHLLEQDRNA